MGLPTQDPVGFSTKISTAGPTCSTVENWWCSRSWFPSLFCLFWPQRHHQLQLSTIAALQNSFATAEHRHSHTNHRHHHATPAAASSGTFLAHNTTVSLPSSLPTSKSVSRPSRYKNYLPPVPTTADAITCTAAPSPAQNTHNAFRRHHCCYQNYLPPVPPTADAIACTTAPSPVQKRATPSVDTTTTTVLAIHHKTPFPTSTTTTSAQLFDCCFCLWRRSWYPTDGVCKLDLDSRIPSLLLDICRKV